MLGTYISVLDYKLVYLGMRIKDYETYHTNPFEHLVSPHIRLKRFEDKNVRGVPHANLETGETSYLTPFNPILV